MSQISKVKPNWLECWNTDRNSTKQAEEWAEKQKCTSASSAWWMFASRSASELQAWGGCSNSPIKPNEGRCPRAAEPWPCNTFSSSVLCSEATQQHQKEAAYFITFHAPPAATLLWVVPSLVLQGVGLTEDAVKARPACLLLHHPLNSYWCTMLNAWDIVVWMFELSIFWLQSNSCLQKLEIHQWHEISENQDTVHAKCHNCGCDHLDQGSCSAAVSHYTALDSEMLCSPAAHYIPIFKEIMHSSSLGWLTKLERQKGILWTLNHPAQTGFHNVSAYYWRLLHLCSALFLFPHQNIYSWSQINLLSCHTRHTQETEAVLSYRLNCSLKPPSSPGSEAHLASLHPGAF